jgi:hypothetical protein
MTGYLDIVVPLAITGAGVVTGLLFAFSNFVISSLAELPNDKGMYAMQRINEDTPSERSERHPTVGMVKGYPLIPASKALSYSLA